MNWEKRQEIMDIANKATYLLGLHISTNTKEIVAETEEGEDYIVEIEEIQFPKTDSKTRNKYIQDYFTEQLNELNMQFVKLEKSCFDNQIYYHLCYEEVI